MNILGTTHSAAVFAKLVFLGWLFLLLATLNRRLRRRGSHGIVRRLGAGNGRDHAPSGSRRIGRAAATDLLDIV